MKRTLVIAIATLGIMLGSAGCTPQDAARDAIKQSFPDQYSKALKVATCESGLNPEAVSAGGGNVGLFQINRVHESRVKKMGYTWSKMTDPYVNARVARSLYDESGWHPWSCG